MAQAEDVVLYDLDDQADPEALIAMAGDPEARWFARARLAALAVRGLVAATWNPILHPRGKDGQFINKWGWVRWIEGGKWRRGQVTYISDQDGSMIVVPAGSTAAGGKVFHPGDVASKLYKAPTPKAALSLPDPKAGIEGQNFTQVGGQGGSNPGGMYVAKNNFGSDKAVNFEQLVTIVDKHGLNSNASLGYSQPAIGWLPAGQDGVGGMVLFSPMAGVIVDAKGMPAEVFSENIAWYTGENVAEAWGEMSAVADLLSDGQKVYIKTAKSADHAKNEVLANRLYELAGVNVAETMIGKDGVTLASKVVPEHSTKVNIGAALDDAEVMSRMREDFVVDAWLANWDVAGLGLENTQVVDGYPYRIDAGGALLYRAQGSPKGAAFGTVVGELETLRDPHMNPAAAKVFGKTTDAEMKAGAERIAAISPEMIKAHVEASGLPSSLADTLIARREYILDTLHVPIPENVDEPAEPAAAPIPAKAEMPQKVEPTTGPAVGPSMTWSSTDQTWNQSHGGPATLQEPLNALTEHYDNPAFFQDEDIAQLEAAPGEALHVLHNGRLWTVDDLEPNGDGSVVMTGISVSEPDMMRGFTISGPVRVMRTEASQPAYKGKGAALKSIIANETLARERSITQIATSDSIAEVFESAGMDTYGNEPQYDAPYPPQFQAEDADLISSSGVLVLNPSTPTAKMLWDIDGDHLYQIIDINNSGGVDLMDPISGEYVSPASMGFGSKAVKVVDSDDTFSMELLEALIQREKAAEWENGTGVDNSDAPSLDETTTAVLDSKAEVAQVEDVAPLTVPLSKPPADAQIDWTDAYYGLSEAMTAVDADTGISSASWSGIMNSFHDQIGSGGPVTYATMEAFLEAMMPALVAPFDAWLKDHPNYADTPGDLPGAVDNTPPVPPVHTPGVSDQLSVGEQFTFESSLSAEAKSRIAENLIGKMIMLTLKDYGVDPDDPADPADLGYVSSGNPVATLAYVEEYNADSQRLWFRLPNGEKKAYNVGGYSNKAIFRIVENLDPEILKSAASPTTKADGTITYGGQVVGKWEQTGGYGWSKKYSYTIFGVHSIFGKDTVGTLSKKTAIKNFASYLLVPKAPPTKAKKSSPAAKKIAEAVKVMPTVLEGAKLSDGTQAQLGDWIKSTKGGGGFVGKIVGWPNQEMHPGLVFAVSPDGVQKAVKLSTQKKVSAPTGEQVAISDALNVVPSAYTLIKLADGKEPQVGQHVQAGKPGGNKVTGIITNINPAQGWVYILTPEGKTVSKTYSVTTVLDEPDLIWDANAAATAAALVTKKGPKVPKKAKAGPGPSYPGPDDALLDQPQAIKDAWLDANPKRKLTKDGYAPFVGMRARNKAGDELVVLEVAGEWDANPNRVKLLNITQNKNTTGSTTSIEVDHDAELTSYTGAPVEKANSLYIPTAQDPSANYTQAFPDGSVIYRYSTEWNYWSVNSQKYRTGTEWEHVIVTPTGQASWIKTGWSGEALISTPSATNAFASVLKHAKPKSMEKVAVIDSGSDKQLSITPYYKAGYGDDAIVNASSIEFTQGEVINPVVPDEPVNEPEPITPPPAPEAEVPAPVVDVEPEPEPEPDPVDEEPEKVAPEVVAPPKVISSGITVLAPPPSPAPLVKAKKVDPDVPVVTGAADLAEMPKILEGTSAKTMKDAAAKMLEQKDSKAPGTASVYSLGDSDYIEDMAVRFQVEKRADGTEHLVARFRLREDISEGTMAKLVTSGEGKTGAWKLEGTKFAKDLTDGDRIAIYVSGTTKLLKPENDSHPLDEPNARVVGSPKFVGKTTVGKDENGVFFDLYRVTVITDQGVTGEVDMEQRPTSSVKTFEYDHDAPAKSTGSNLHITATAQQAGWARTGKLDAQGVQGQVHIDDTGKVQWPGSMVGSMAKGTGGHRMQKVENDGTKILFQSAHSTEGGTGYDTTRRANISGEVQISTPITGDRPQEAIIESISKAMQLVGVPPEKQGAPTDEQLVNFALAKMVTNFHPTYTYRDKPIAGPEDKRVQETLAYLSKELQKYLGRNVTLDDIRIHTHSSGRMQPMFSPEVAKAIGKRQSTHHYTHHGSTGERAVNVFGGVANGLLSTDERWSMGVMTTGMSSHTDMTIGSGDRVYTSSVSGPTFTGGNVIINPMMQAAALEVYTKGVGDNYGRRTTKNVFLTHTGGAEYMFKRGYEPEQIALYIAPNSTNRDDIIAKLKARGVTHIGGRKIEDIVVTSDMAKKIANFDSLGEEFFKDDIPITALIKSEPVAA